MRPANRAMKANAVTLPAPVGGLNARDAVSAMSPQYAFWLRNLFPTPTSLEKRKGYASQTTVTTEDGTAMGFVRYGDSSLWVASINRTTDVMTLKDIVAGTTQTINCITSYAPCYTQFANSAGTFAAIVFRNTHTPGSLNYYTFDGTTWTDRTGSTTGSEDFTYVATFRNRLWFLKDDLSAWYLPALAITGTPVEFPLGGLASKGGSLYAIGTWTLDGGDGGMDDMIVFITTNGQVIAYRGIDPSSSATFELAGTFDIAKPIGRPYRYGADLLIPCDDGLYSMKEILRGNTAPEFTISNIIRPLWLDAAKQTRAIAALFGFNDVPQDWVSIAHSPKLSHLMVKFRQSGANGTVSSTDYVMNAVSGAWTCYTLSDSGYNHDVLKGDVYFANVVDTTTTVYKFGAVEYDPNGWIGFSCVQAYATLPPPGRQKQVTGVKPSFRAGGSTRFAVNIGSNYANASATLGAALLPGVSAYSSYAEGSHSPILHAPVVGDALCVAMAGDNINDQNATFAWYSTTMLTVPGSFV